MRRYEKYEFCKSVNCYWLIDNKCKGGELVGGCAKSAKEFHKWLSHNMFVIQKPENEYEANGM